MPNGVRFRPGDGSDPLEGRVLDGEERVGEGARFELEVFAPEPVAVDALVGTIGVLELETPDDARASYVYVAAATTIATAQNATGRRYRLSLRSGLSFLELSRRARIFQDMTVPEIVTAVLTAGGYSAENVVVQTTATHAKRRYVVQHDETDAAFLRRLCEDDGLWFRFENGEAGEKLVLHDDSTVAPTTLEAPLVLMQPANAPGVKYVFPLAVRRARRVGKVTLRDYDYEHADLALEGVAASGNDVEQSIEVYEAPGSFKTTSEGKARAKLRLEQLRADATLIRTKTNAVSVRPGTLVEIEPGPRYDGPGVVAAKHFVVAMTHRFRNADGDAYEVVLETIPSDVPYRLPRVTPRPIIHGIQSAKVTGPAGEEIHTDDQGRVNLKFPWDRDGPTDETSSLPIRVAQPNLPGPMIIPRVGWEVLVAFEDGDPERPIVVGKTYNAQQVPPQALPANKTVTSVSTWSSPGGGAMNAVHFDDAAGRQNIRIVAGFAKTVAVANDAVVQTAKVEKTSIKGSKGSTVGANENVSVKQAHIVMCASQSATVGAMQKVFVKGNMTLGVASETVLIGAALMEKVGNPVTGALNLAQSAALAGIGSRGRAGQIAAFGLGMARGGVEGFMRGGWRGAADAVGNGVLGEVAGRIPGGDAVLSAVTGGGSVSMFSRPAPPGGAAAAGGGAGGGESDSAGAAGPGPGHRTQLVKGAYTELVGGSYNVVTPGSISWQVVGASTFLVGGSHSTRTKSHSQNTLGASTELLGTLKIKATTDVIRNVRGAMTVNVAGALKSTAGGKHIIKAGGALQMTFAGALKLDGAHVTFTVGSSKVSASPGGVLIEATDIEITGTSKQSGVTGHA